MRLRVLLMLCTLVLDQGTKHLFGGQLNTGISFSLFQFSPIFLVATQLVFLVCVARLMRNDLCAGLILGGGISNTLDRIFFGGVRDWMTLPILGLQNNLADWAIVGGLVCAVIVQYRDDVASTSHSI